MFYSPKIDTSGMQCVREIGQTLSLPTQQTLFSRNVLNTHKKHNKIEPSLFEEEITCTEMLSLCSKTCCCCGRRRNEQKFSSESLNKRTVEDWGDGPMSKYRKVLNESRNVTLTNGWFRTDKLCLEISEQNLRKLYSFSPKRTVEEDGIPKKTLTLVNFHSIKLWSLYTCKLTL